MHCLWIFIGLLALTFSSLSSAATAFDFTGLGSADETASIDVLSDDGLITATVFAPDGNLGASNLSGLGAKSTGALADPIQNGEFLQINFSVSVNVDSITMSQWEGIDLITLTSSAGGTPIILSGDSCTICSEEAFSLGLFGIESITLQGGSLSTATYLNGLSGVTQVPVPAALWLFGSALGLLGWIKRPGGAAL